MHTHVVSSNAPAPRFRYTPCLRAGTLGFVSGMVGLDPASGALVEGGVAAQTQRIFDNLRLALPDYGFTLAQLCIARVYLAPMDGFAAFNTVWERQFADTAPNLLAGLKGEKLPNCVNPEVQE